MLMVGTLRCRIGGREGEANYNDFATRQHNVLGANAYVLKAHYLRENGIQAGRSAYDQSVTLLANKHASRLDDPSFCSTVAAYARMAASASSEDLLVLAQSVVEAPVSGPCRTKGAYAEALPPVAAYAPAPYEMPAQAPVMPAIYEPAPPMEAAPLPALAPPPPPLPAVAEAPVAVAPPAEKARTVLASAVIPNAPIIPPVETPAAAAAATPEQALEAAITALQAATAALRARPAPIQH